MFRHIVFRIIAGIVLLVAIASLGIFAYQAGVAHGLAANVQVSTVGSPELVRGMPYERFVGFPGFGLFGVLFAFFLLFLAFGAMRRLIWGPRWGMRHMGYGAMGRGPMGHGPWGEGVPPMFAEWHRRAHMSPQEAAADAEKQPGDNKSGG
jgi:hypothetical protein